MAFDLIVLGRQLARIGETVMRGQAPPAQPTIAGMVLADVFAHPGSSISEITARTGMPQSHVSETVARLRELTCALTWSPRRSRRLLPTQQALADFTAWVSGYCAAASRAGAIPAPGPGAGPLTTWQFRRTPFLA